MKNRPTMRKFRGLSRYGAVYPERATRDEGARSRESRIPICVITVFAVCLFLQFACPKLYSQAQAFNASLDGSVYDHTGAFVPGAKVTLSDSDTGVSRTFTTGGDGHYSFTLVPAGTYKLQVEAPGFRRYIQSGRVLAVGQAATQDVTLQLGQ